jgi:hypothetical protein
LEIDCVAEPFEVLHEPLHPLAIEVSLLSPYFSLAFDFSSV